MAQSFTFFFRIMLLAIQHYGYFARKEPETGYPK